MYSDETMMDMESTFEVEPLNSVGSNQFSNGEYNSNDSSHNNQLHSSLTRSQEPSCKRLKRSSALLKRSITNFNGYHGQAITNIPNSSAVDSNSLTRSETTSPRNLNEGFEKAFDSIQLSSGPRMTPPIVILTDLTTNCIKSRRLI